MQPQRDPPERPRVPVAEPSQDPQAPSIQSRAPAAFPSFTPGSTGAVGDFHVEETPTSGMASFPVL